jgi:hypothetical protein
MQSRLGLAFTLLAICLTLAYHTWTIPHLRLFLLPGVMAHAAVTPDSILGSTDAHGGTLWEERIGFATELTINAGVYFLLGIVVARLRIAFHR